MTPLPLTLLLLLKATPMTTLTDSSRPHAERVKAAKTLATSKDPLAIDALVKTLQTMDVELRDAALASLQKQGASEKLIARLDDPTVAEPLKVTAATGLRYLHEKKAVPALAKALGSPSAVVKKEAALALSVIGAEPAAAELIAALDDADSDVRYFSAEALGTVKNKAVERALAARLEKETNPTVKYVLGVSIDKQSR